MGFIGPEGRRQLKLTARFATAGIELVVAIIVGYFGGRYLDRWLGTDPVCGYVGLILGIIAGFRNLFLLARTANRPSLETSDEPERAPDLTDTSRSTNENESTPKT